MYGMEIEPPSPRYLHKSQFIYSNKYKTMEKFFVAIALVTITFFSVNASTLVQEETTPALVEVNQEPVSVFVHISAIKIGKNGLKMAKIAKITLAKGQEPAKNKFKAKLRKVDNRLQFEIQMQKKQFDQLTMPKGFILNDRIAKLLGTAEQVVMSGGSTMLKKSSNGLLHFEIQ